MKKIDGQLYLEIADAVEAGFGDASYIYKEKSRGAKWAVFIKDPLYANQVLIEYESLPDSKKQKVIARFGNPYDHYSKDPIRKLVTKDIAAEKFFFEYRFDNDKSLPPQTILKYTTAASWLKMLISAQEDFRIIKKEIGISVSKFWLDVSELVKTDGISLPSDYSELLKKIKRFKCEGYATLIHKQFGNSNAKKVDCEVSKSLLLKLISMPNSDDHTTARRYNTWAAKNNKDQITARTVTNWKNENMPFIASQKYGIAKNYNIFGKHIQRFRPTHPLALVEHDDNELDLYFQGDRKKNGRAELYYFHRYVLAVVIDAYNDYPLGWAIAETYTKNLIRFAYLDAVHHIHDLTGNYYLPHQIRCDHFGLDPNLTNDLADFYRSIAIFTPAKVKVARGKYIERSFGKQWHQALGLYPNYAGTNVTSKGQVPKEFIDENSKNYPHKSKAPEQAAHFINILRHLVDEKTGKSRQEQWLQGFAESDKAKQHLISEEQMLFKLGTHHPHKNKITNRGITPSINCEERTYEVPEHLYLETIGRTVNVVYDPMDYSRILLTDGGSLRFIARQIELMPSAISDYKPGDRKKIQDRIDEKARHMLKVADFKQNIDEVLDRSGIDAQSLIMAGVHSKAENHEAILNYVPVDRPIKSLPKQNKALDDIDDILDEA